MDLTNDVLKEECVELPFSQLHAGRKRYGLLLLHVVICIQYGEESYVTYRLLTSEMLEESGSPFEGLLLTEDKGAHRGSFI